MTQIQRRDFLKSSATAAALGGLGSKSLIAAPVTTSSNLAPVHQDIAPLVRLIEETPREKATAVLAERWRAGIPYRDLLAAVYLTAIRNHTSGHHVFMMHAVHQMSLDAARKDRLLPLWWALDCVKSPRRTTPMLKPLDTSRLPKPSQAAEFFDAAMSECDFQSAERAIVSLARSVGPQQAYAKHWWWGAARNGGGAGGHAAIGVSNSFRTCNVIGWQMAEPALRYAILSSIEDKENSGLRLVNLKRAERVSEFPAGWAGGQSDPRAVVDLLAQLREANTASDCASTFEALLTEKLNAATIWDAILLYSSEQMIRYAVGGHSGRPLHAVTMSNALHYAFRTCRKPELRLYTLLEAIHWTTVMNATIDHRGLFRDVKIDDLPKVDSPDSAEDAIEEIFALLPPLRFGHWYRDKSAQDKAMQLAYAFANRHRTAHPQFFQVARHYLCRKATLNAHDLKFPIALMENYQQVSPKWRPHLLASAIFYLHGPQTEDNQVYRQAAASF